MSDLVAFISDQIRHHTMKSAEYKTTDMIGAGEAKLAERFHAAEARRLIALLPDIITQPDKPDASSDQN